MQKEKERRKIALEFLFPVTHTYRLRISLHAPGHTHAVGSNVSGYWHLNIWGICGSATGELEPHGHSSLERMLLASPLQETF